MHALNKALKDESAQFDLERRLTGEISNQLSSAPLNTADPSVAKTSSDLILQVQLNRVTLRETHLKWYALEIGLSVGLFDAREKRTLWKHDYLYSVAKTAPNHASIMAQDNPDPTGSEAPFYEWLNYETAIGPPVTPHKFAEYEGPAGIQLFHSQLGQAVTDIGNDIARRFREAGFSE